MGCIAGRIGKVEVSFDNGDTWLNLGKVVDASVSGNVDELECTSHDSPGVREYAPNFRDETLDASMRWDEDNPAQVNLIYTVYPTPSTFKVRYMPEKNPGRLMFEADAFVTSYNPSSPLDDTASFDVSMRLSGTSLVTQLA